MKIGNLCNLYEHQSSHLLGKNISFSSTILHWKMERMENESVIQEQSRICVIDHWSSIVSKPLDPIVIFIIDPQDTKFLLLNTEHT